jgi:hypothetical protein
MRSLLILATVVGISGVTACSDEQQQPTSPAVANPRVSSRFDVPATSADGIRVPDAKPTPTPAFTKVFMVESPTYTTVVWSVPTSVTATCPAGSTPIGGSWDIGNYLLSQYLSLVKAGFDGANGWTMTVRNTDPNLFEIFVRVQVICIQ